MIIFRSIHRRLRHIPIPVLLMWVVLYGIISIIFMGMLSDEIENPIQSDPNQPDSFQSDLTHSISTGDHTQEIPSYYPMKTKGLFTRYIVVDDHCSFAFKNRTSLDSTVTATLEEEQMKKYSTTDMLSESSTISMDFESMKCEQLMTLHGNILWRMSFDILVDLNLQQNVIHEFEVYVTSNKIPRKMTKDYVPSQTRSAGKVFDGEIIKGSDDKLQRKHRAEFFIFEPLRMHQVEVYLSHWDKYFDFEEKGDPNLMQIINSEWAERKKRGEDASFAELFEAIRNHSDLVGVDLGKKVFERTQRGFQAKYFIGSALFNTPFQIATGDGSYFKPPKHFCFEEQFHYDVYQQGNGDVKFDEKTMAVKYKGSSYPIYTMNRRIGRWENINTDAGSHRYNREAYGVWIEPDCIWSLDHFYPFEKVDAIFTDGFHLRFTGDSNHQHTVTAANRELVPNDNGVNVADYSYVHLYIYNFTQNIYIFMNDRLNGTMCCLLTANHNISFEWFFFRGSRMYKHATKEVKYSDSYMKDILNHNWDCRKAWGFFHDDDPYLKDSAYKYPPNFSSMNAAMWFLDYGLQKDIKLLAEGIGFLTKECNVKYPEFTKTALFWRQSYAIAMRRAPKITHRRRLILANGQAESSTELFLKELEGQITGVFLDFERTYARQWKEKYDSVHMFDGGYDFFNHDMFNEIFRYIPANMHSRCFKRFDEQCKKALAKKN